MKLYGVLVLMALLSTVAGLRCFVCAPGDPCQPQTCPEDADRCATIIVGGRQGKNCFISFGCSNVARCCSGDLCNGAITTGSSVLLMLVSSAIFTLFL